MFGNELSYNLEIDGFKLADIPEGGGLATAFTSPGKVAEDTIEVTPDDPTETDFMAQGEDTPLESAVKAGVRKGSCNLVRVAPEVAADLLGGEFKNGQYHATRNYKGVERALQLIDGKGMTYTYPRVRITAKVVGRFRLSEVNHIALSWKVLLPLDASVAPEIIGKLTTGS